MKITFKTAFVFAAIWIGLKLLGLKLGFNIPSNTTFFVLTNMFFLLASVAIGLYLQKLKGVEDDSILTDIKNGMTSGVIYSVVICGFLYFYYEKIDPEYNQKMVAEREAYFKTIVDDPIQLKKLKESNTELEVMSNEEIMKEFRKTPQMLFSGNFIMIYGILSMFMLSTLYSVVIAVIYRKFLFRQF